MTELAVDVFLKNKEHHQSLKNKRLAFLGHSASVTKHLKHSLLEIQKQTDLKFQCVFSPQHGFYGVEQANMITTKDSVFPGEKNKLSVFSLYSEKNRRLNPEMLDLFDVLLVDLQSVGCRVYTYLTTLFYVLEDCARAKKEVWILDRPNPAGRTVEGSLLHKNYESFVGAGPLPIRHGMTLGEMARWYCDLKKLKSVLKVIKMENYQPLQEPWPKNLLWVLPSPNMVDEECVRCYSGTVLLEGTFVSEARGTVFPLKAFGFPGMNSHAVLDLMQKIAPAWLKGCALRAVSFKPVFDKFENQDCSALRIYADGSFYSSDVFKPYRLVSLFLKCVKKVHPDFSLFTNPPYEYEYQKMPLDILSGDGFLRDWINSSSSQPQDLEDKLSKDEELWIKTRKPYLLY